MFLSKRKNGYWYIVYNNEKGKRTAITTKTKNINIAKPIFNKFKKDYLFKDFNLTIKELITKFLESQKENLSKGAIQNYNTILNEFSLLFKDMKANELNQYYIDHYITYISKRSEPSTFNNKISKIKMLFDFAIKNGFINKNFCFTIIKVVYKDVNEKESLRVIAAKFNVDWYLATLKGIDKLEYELGLLKKEKAELQHKLNDIQVNIDNKIYEIENYKLRLNGFSKN